MTGKMISCFVLWSTCVAGALYGQTAPPSSQSEISGRMRIPALAESQVEQTSVVRPEGTPDEVVSLNCVALISALKIENNVVTFTGMNQLRAGQEVSISKLNRASYLNGTTLKVLSATPEGFTANFSHADVPRLSDGGTALRTDCVAQGSFVSNQKVGAFHNHVNYFRRHLSSDIQISSYDQFRPLEVDEHYANLVFNQPSYSWGNNGGWGVQKHLFEDLTFNGRGIAQAHNLFCHKHAVGDTACGDYIYGYTDGGSTAQSDEGFTVDTREGGESDNYFHGRAGAGARAGERVLPVVFSSGQEATTDGAYMLDISKGTIFGIVSGADAIQDGTSTHILPVTVSSKDKLTPSTGIGILQTPIPVIAKADVPESIQVEIALTHGSFKPGIACLAGGWYPEQVSITSVSAVSGSRQQVTLIHKNPNPTAATDPHNPSSLWQGGPCGSYLSLDRNLARDGFRTSYFVVGAPDSGHLGYVWNVNGSTRQNGIKLYAAPAPLKQLVRKDGVVTAHFARANASVIYNHAPSVVIADATDSSFNGMVASPEYGVSRDGSVSWKQAGPDATAASATIDLAPASYGFHLYPGAEVLGPQTSQGVPLEPNSVAWTPGDVIENPHNPSFQMRFRANLVIQHTPPSGADSHGEVWAFKGAGISLNFRPSRWINTNPCSLYIGCGGTLEPITWIMHQGPYSILHRVDSAPMNGGALFRIGCDSLGCDHPSPYNLFELQNGFIAYDPKTSTVSTASIRTGKLAAADVAVERLSFAKAPDKGSDCLGIVDHVIVSGSSQSKSAPCVASITWQAGKGLAVQQGGTAAKPIYTIVPEPGYYIPRSDGRAVQPASSSDSVATITVGSANRAGAAACASGYRCTASRGRIAVVGTQGASAGKIVRVQANLSQGEICTATQNGGTAFLGIGSSGESGDGFDITSGVPVAGKATIDYFCR